MANVKNYNEQGGAKTVIGGEIQIADGGKLKVDSGATVEGISAGGGGVLYAKRTYNASLDAYVIDKTFNEMYGAIQDGSMVVVFAETTGSGNIEKTFDLVMAIGLVNAKYYIDTMNTTYQSDSASGLMKEAGTQ